MSNEDKQYLDSADDYLDSLDFDNMEAELEEEGLKPSKNGKQKAPEDEYEDEVLEGAEEDFEDDEEFEDDFDDLDDEDQETVKLDDETIMDYKLKLKVDGKEVEASVQELADSYELQKSSRQRFNEATKMRQQVEAAITQLRNPDSVWDALKLLGHDIDDLADKYVVKRHRLQRMDPRERQLYEKEQQLREYEAKVNQERQQKERQQQEELAKQMQEKLKPEINSALKSVGLPNSKKSFVEVVKTMYEYKQAGHQISADQAARITKKRIEEDMKSFFENTPAEELEKIGASKGKPRQRKRNKSDAPTITNKRDRSDRRKDRGQFRNSEEFFNSLDY